MALRPAFTRCWIMLASNSEKAPVTWKSSMPVGVVVSRCCCLRGSGRTARAVRVGQRKCGREGEDEEAPLARWLPTALSGCSREFALEARVCPDTSCPIERAQFGNDWRRGESGVRVDLPWSRRPDTPANFIGAPLCYLFCENATG